MKQRNVLVSRPSARTWVVGLVALLLVLVGPLSSYECAAATWSDEDTVASGSIISENRVALDGDRVYVVYTNFAEGEFHVHLKWFDGRMWSTIMDVGASATDARFPAISAEDGIAHVAYSDSTDGDIDIKYVSFDGESVSKPVQISDPVAGKNANYPAIAADDGEVHIVWEEWTGGDRDIYHRGMEGKSWGPITEISTDDHDEDQKNPDVAVSRGRVHAVWEDRADGDVDIYHRSAEDSVWSPEVEVSKDTATEVQQNPAVAAFGDLVYVAYDHLGTSPLSAIHMTTFDGTWSAPEKVSEGLTPPFQEEARLAAEDGNVAIVYRKSSGVSDEVHFRHFNGTAWSPEEEISDGVATTSHIAPDVGLEAGRAHAIWHDYTGTAKLLKHRFADLGPLSPSAEVLDISPYWMDTSSATLGWTARDDYSVRSVTVQHRHSTDGVEWGTWTTSAIIEDLWGTEVSGTIVFTAPDGDGFYEFRASATDARGRTDPAPEGAEAEGAFDGTPPTGSIVINGGDELTGDPAVTLTLTYQDATSGVAKVRFSSEMIGGDEPWDDPVDTKEWDLGAQGGTKTVYYQVIDVAGLVSEVYSASITLNTDEPTGSIALASGATSTNAATVTLALGWDGAASDVVGIRVSQEAIGGDEPWDDPVGTMELTLTGGDGVKNIYFQVINADGLESDVYKLTITLDTTNPFVDSVEPDDGAVDVEADVRIVVRFSEPMNKTATAGAARLWWGEAGGSSEDVAVTITWSPDGRTMTIKPDADLAAGTEYHLIIGGRGAMDALGNELFPTVDHSFTTEGGGNGGDGGDDDGGGPFLWIMLVAVLVVVVVGVLGFMMAKGSNKGGTTGSAGEDGEDRL